MNRIGIDVVLCLAGLVGSLISVGRQSATNLRKTLANIAAGVGSANYLTPVIVGQLGHGPDQKWSMGLAFILGTLGLRMMELVNQRVEAEIAKRYSLPPKQENKK